MRHRPTWAILCGKVRDPTACLRKLQTLREWRRRGTIDGVVFTSWIGDLEPGSLIDRALDDLDAHVIEIAEPMLRLPGHVLHQMLAIHYALQLVPESARVLRLRPDLIELSDAMAAFLSDPPDLTPAPPPGWPSPFQERIVVIEGFALSPFYLNDMTFMGRVPDVRRLLGMDVRSEALFSQHAPEQWFFATPFLPMLPILDSYYPLASGLRFQDAAWSRRFVTLHLQSAFFRDVLLTYLLCLRAWFRIGFHAEQPLSEAYAGIDLMAALLGGVAAPQLATRSNLGLPILQGDAVVRAILEGAFQRDCLTEALADQLATVSDPAFQAGWRGSALRPTSAMVAFRYDVAAPLACASVRADTRDDPAHRRFRIPYAGDRWQVLSGSDTFGALLDENNHLRRTVDQLQGRLTREMRSAAAAGVVAC